MYGRSIFIIVALVLSGCGAIRPDGKHHGVFQADGEGGLLGGGGDFHSRRLRPDSIPGKELRVTDFDIPVVINHRVEHWIDFFTGPAREHFEIYLERFEEMQPVIVSKLEKAGLPKDLIFLAMIESGFSTAAHSPAGAVGPWQFMRSTGRLYGLDSNWWIDERKDPVKATDAAVRYLKKLYDEFGKWELAIAAYNAGEGRIRNAMERYHTNDFWEIVATRALRMETRDYVPKFMAAAIIAKNPESFGFRTPQVRNTWLTTKTVYIPKPEDIHKLAKISGLDLQTVKDLNPELLRWATPPGFDHYTLRVPEGMAYQNLVAAIDHNEVGSYQAFKRYIVRRGDTLSAIAHRHRTSIGPILTLNNLRDSRRLRPGTSLVLPVRSGGGNEMEPSRASERIPASETINETKDQRYYVVKKGDTLYEISRRYSVSIDSLKQWNSIRHAHQLRPGRRLKLYVAAYDSSI